MSWWCLGNIQADSLIFADVFTSAINKPLGDWPIDSWILGLHLLRKHICEQPGKIFQA